MKILLHTCCAPCTTYCYKHLREAGHEVEGFFYNPNIHPYTEYRKRLEEIKKYAEKVNLLMNYKNKYDLVEFLREISYREAIRCRFCYHMRLREAARVAEERKFDSFTTTLLLSPYQRHHLISEVGQAIGKEFEVPFYYEDFRIGYKESIQLSKELALYRQSYCGCIYSEKEKYLR
jgi:hypothetical protein